MFGEFGFATMLNCESRLVEVWITNTMESVVLAESI